MIRIILAAAFVTSLVVAGGRHSATAGGPAMACDCHGGGPVCQDFWKTPVVFLGRVSAATPLNRSDGFGPHERVEFQVLEAFRGTSAARIELFNYPTSCHHGYRTGEEWMIYASPRHDGPGLSTGTCSRTTPRSNAEVDLSYARSAYAKSPEKGLITGTVSDRTGTDPAAIDRPLAGVTVVAHHDWLPSSSAVTNRDGQFLLFVSPGLYRLIPQAPAGLRMRPSENLVQLPDARGCATAGFYAEKSR